MADRVSIGRLETGIPGLDALLGGGLPDLSFNLIAGSPGAGKTTLAHQIMFSLASPDRRAIYFTVLGEPPVKMLRYQQQFPFFDFEKVNQSIRFVNLGEEVLHGGVDQVLQRIQQEVEAFSPGLVFVDSFRSVILTANGQPAEQRPLQQFVQELGMHLTNWQATTFLIGEFEPAESATSPIFTVADGVIWLSQNIHQESMVRKIEIRKMRGQPTLPGLHTFRIDNSGITVFPRAIIGADINPPRQSGDRTGPLRRLSLGVAELDRMLGGGLPAGYSMLLAGPAGSGKSILATQFLAEGARVGEPGIIAAFEKSPSQSMNPMLDQLVRAGHVGVIDTRSLDLSIDETLADLIAMMNRTKARRVVIDSLSGYELALAPPFRENFRDSIYRLVAALTNLGATVLMICELEDRYNDLRFSPYGAAFLTDAIIVQRYVQLDGCLKRMLAVVKVRASAHSNEMRLFEITEAGIEIGEPLSRYEGLLSAHPEARQQKAS